MKYIIILITATLLAACSTTTITETTYNPDGSVIAEKTTEMSGNPFVVLAQNSAQKSWVVHQGGWYFNLGVDATNSGSYGINGGSIDNTLASVQDSKYGVEFSKYVPDILAQSKYSVSVSSDGIGSESAVKDKAE